MPSSRGSSGPSDQTCSSCIAGGFFIMSHQGSPVNISQTYKIRGKKIPLMRTEGLLLTTFKYNMLLLSCFSCVQLCATPETAAHQAPPSLGFSRQEHSPVNYVFRVVSYIFSTYLSYNLVCPF